MLCCSHCWCDFYIYLLLILLLLFSLLLYSCYYCKKLRKLLPSWFKIGDIQRVFPKYLHFWEVIFRICLENFRKDEVILRNICERPIANHGFCDRNRISFFSNRNAVFVGERTVFGKQSISCRLLFLVPSLSAVSHRSPTRLSQFHLRSCRRVRDPSRRLEDARNEGGMNYGER